MIVGWHVPEERRAWSRAKVFLVTACDTNLEFATPIPLVWDVPPYTNPDCFAETDSLESARLFPPHRLNAMFGQIRPTEFDLHFSMFGISIRVHPAFWIVGAIMGWNDGIARVLEVNVLVPVLLWLAVIFVSILVHELGHALTAQHFGWPPEITLYHFGGLASYRPTFGYTPRRRVLISLAGPGAGFLLYGLIRGAEFWMVEVGYVPPPLLRYVLFQAEWVNLYWGLINLLPVLPLDGGHVAEEICKAVRPRDGEYIAIQLAILVAGGVAFYLLSHHEQFGLYPGVLFGMLCYMNFQSLQQRRGP